MWDDFITGPDDWAKSEEEEKRGRGNHPAQLSTNPFDDDDDKRLGDISSRNPFDPPMSKPIRINPFDDDSLSELSTPTGNPFDKNPLERKPVRINPFDDSSTEGGDDANSNRNSSRDSFPRFYHDPLRDTFANLPSAAENRKVVSTNPFDNDVESDDDDE